MNEKDLKFLQEQDTKLRKLQKEYENHRGDNKELIPIFHYPRGLRLVLERKNLALFLDSVGQLYKYSQGKLVKIHAEDETTYHYF